MVLVITYINPFITNTQNNQGYSACDQYKGTGRNPFKYRRNTG